MPPRIWQRNLCNYNRVPYIGASCNNLTILVYDLRRSPETALKNHLCCLMRTGFKR